MGITYDESGRMLFDGLSNECGCEHHKPTQDIYVGNGLMTVFPSILYAGDLERIVCSLRMKQPTA